MAASRPGGLLVSTRINSTSRPAVFSVAGLDCAAAWCNPDAAMKDSAVTLATSHPRDVGVLRGIPGISFLVFSAVDHPAVRPARFHPHGLLLKAPPRARCG